MGDSIDVELLTLLTKLNKIQREIGGGKNDKGTVGILMGGGDKMDRFTDLEIRVNDRLSIIKSSIEDIQRLEKAQSTNPKELIQLQSTVRTELAAVSDEWKDMDMIHRIEAKKKRSRHSPEELARREAAVTQAQAVIQTLKDLQRQGFVKQYQGCL
jgi:SYP7 family syntaxin